jgi:transcriptional regulator with XRE-family HTH domain
MAALVERIRNRRTALGLSGIELARRAGISPSYVSLIERGLKVPNEEVAARLARALEDDEDLYRAWARAERYGLDKLDHLQRLDQLTTTAETSRWLASGRDLPPAAAAPRAAASPPPASAPSFMAKAARLFEPLVRARSPAPAESGQGPPALEEADADMDFAMAPDVEPPEEDGISDRVLEVPVLPPGADPRRVLDAVMLPPLHLDARLLGAASTTGLFAYQLDREAAARLGELASAGDYVVLSRRVRRLSADRVYAVRGEDDRVHLARVLFKGSSLLLLPAPGRSDIEVVPLREHEAWRERIVGVLVLTLKRWS